MAVSSVSLVSPEDLVSTGAKKAMRRFAAMARPALTQILIYGLLAGPVNDTNVPFSKPLACVTSKRMVTCRVL